MVHSPMLLKHSPLLKSYQGCHSIATSWAMRPPKNWLKCSRITLHSLTSSSRATKLVCSHWNPVENTFTNHYSQELLALLRSLMLSSQTIQWHKSILASTILEMMLLCMFFHSQRGLKCTLSSFSHHSSNLKQLFIENQVIRLVDLSGNRGVTGGRQLKELAEVHDLDIAQFSAQKI